MATAAAAGAAQQVAQIDAAVAEVFEMMLQQPCVLMNGPATDEPCHIISTANCIAATIVFSGSFQGQCTVRVCAKAADRLTDTLLGGEGDWDDQMIDDAVGEMCNMIAGGWKSRLDAQASGCNLSVPAISRSHPCETPPPSSHTARRSYAFGGSALEVSLTIHPGT